MTGYPPGRWVVPYQYSTSNRNTGVLPAWPGCVVPYQYSTSNRNLQQTQVVCRLVVPYQYSTSNRNNKNIGEIIMKVVPYQYSTSNRNRHAILFVHMIVVPYQYSTSNRNRCWSRHSCQQLFLISILHQTATKIRAALRKHKLFLISILHQTATEPRPHSLYYRCSLSVFYIKPQHFLAHFLHRQVVPYQYSTSNRNIIYATCVVSRLFLISILHQTATKGYDSWSASCCSLSVFYIKPQLQLAFLVICFCCSLSVFYIKPQPSYC